MAPLTDQYGNDAARLRQIAKHYLHDAIRTRLTDPDLAVSCLADSKRAIHAARYLDHATRLRGEMADLANRARRSGMPPIELLGGIVHSIWDLHAGWSRD